MRKLILTLIIMCAMMTTAFAAENPTCVMLKFSNDTRYKNIDIASELSDFFIEKLIASGKFNFVETKPIDQDIESMLYNEKARELAALNLSINSRNFNALFEGPFFDSKYAGSIATAEVGQFLPSSITSQIGKSNKAEYIIQGTIINLGNGSWENDDIITSLFGRTNKKSVISVQTDLRIIKSSTGEVVWHKIVTGTKSTTLTNVGGLKFGSSKLTSDMYNQAMEDAAQKIINTLIEDLNSHKLFIK